MCLVKFIALSSFHQTELLLRRKCYFSVLAFGLHEDIPVSTTMMEQKTELKSADVLFSEHVCCVFAEGF